MAYIGNSPANTGNYQIVDDISSSFNGSLTSFALTASSASISPAKSGQLLVSVNGVMQQPDDTGTNGFKVSGSNIVFSSAPATGATFWATFQGQNVDIGTPSDDVVDTAHIKDDAVTAAKLANSINTEIAANTAKTGITTAQASAITANTTTANAALPKAGGTMTGAITNFASTGIDDNGNATAITIDANESIMVNKTSENAATVGAQFRGDAVGLLQVTRDGGDALQLNRLSSDGDIVRFYKDTSEVGSIGVDGGDNFYITGESGNTGGIYINDAAVSPAYQGAERDDYYSLGKAPTRWKDLYLSGGAYIGGTGAANKLDDYEEGNFDIGVSVGSLGSSSKGKYIKIGKQVTVFCQVDGGTNYTSTDGISLTGMPFVSVSPNTTGHAGNGACSYTSNMGGNVISAVLLSGSTTVFFSNLNASSTLYSHCSGSWSVRFTISYETV